MMKTTLDSAMEWFALTKAVVDKLESQGVPKKWLVLVPFAVATGMKRPHYGEAHTLN